MTPAVVAESKRPGSIGVLLGGLFVVALLAIPFIPFFRCQTCWPKRQEIRDWLNEPITQKYQAEHPEVVAQAQEDLRRIDESCTRCYHGRINMVIRYGILSRQSYPADRGPQ